MSESEKKCAEWYKNAMRRFTNIIIIVILIFTPITAFFIISDNINVRIRCNLSDITIPQYQSIEIQKGLFATPSNATLVPDRMDVYLIPEDFNDVIENDRVLTQFMSGIWALQFEEAVNIYNKMNEGKWSFQIISCPLVLNTTTIINIDLSTNYRFMFCLVYRVDFTSLSNDPLQTVSFVSVGDIIGTDPVEISSVLIKPTKFVNLDININSLTILRQFYINEYYEYVYGRLNILIYSRINSYPFRINYTISGSLF